MAYVSMVVVGLSAGQVVWALMPETASMGWMSVLSLGALGGLLGGLVMGFVVHAVPGNGAYLLPLGLVGSLTGTLAVLCGFYLMRRRAG